MIRSKTILVSTFACLMMGTSYAQPIKHSFLVIDEARDSLVYINENTPASNWSVRIDKARDMQLVGRNRVMVSHNSGYAEYDLTSHVRVKNVTVAGGVSGVQSCRRLANGLTLVGTEGITIRTVDSTGTVKRTVNIAGMGTFRVMRNTSRNSWVFGAGDELIETDTFGTVLKKATINGAENLYQAVRCANGTYVASTGYLGTIVKTDSAGVVKKTFGGKPGPTGYGVNFFAGFSLLANGHVVASNWPGHGVNDGANCTGLIQYDTTGAVAWTWMDHARVSSLHAVIILDGVNTAVLNDERKGVVGPVEGTVGIQKGNAGRMGPILRNKAASANESQTFNINGRRLVKKNTLMIADGVLLRRGDQAGRVARF